MGTSTTDGPLEELLAPVVAASGLELDSVTRTRSDAMPLLRVVVEAPIGADGIDSDTLADVSRAVSKALDAADPIDGEYLLEVSTPGAERELTKVGHWKRQVGRLVRVKLRAGGYVSGRVIDAGETSATIDVDGEATTIDYQDMRKARSRVDFGTGK
ncbi:ribosome maturation factor RimP [Actinomyces sp.]|uniref:ribosome maturation factor RimP n=1 Tax=Actinomyces sp. TaxID=29317 RepID=UPI0025BF12FC|nr:ribosome maturation factor RimP [Actinomyces sp.]